jgi:hypothetical protein
VKQVIPPGVAAATESWPYHDRNILSTNSIRVSDAVERIRGRAMRTTSLYPPASMAGADIVIREINIRRRYSYFEARQSGWESSVASFLFQFGEKRSDFTKGGAPGLAVAFIFT